MRTVRPIPIVTPVTPIPLTPPRIVTPAPLQSPVTPIPVVTPTPTPIPVVTPTPTPIPVTTPTPTPIPVVTPTATPIPVPTPTPTPTPGPTPTPTPLPLSLNAAIVTSFSFYYAQGQVAGYALPSNASATPLFRIGGPLGDALGGAAIDARSNVFAADYDARAIVMAPPPLSSSSTLALLTPLDGSPIDVALPNATDAYVALDAPPALERFAQPFGTASLPVARVALAWTPYQVAVDPAAPLLAVATQHGVLVYPAPLGAAAPSATLAGAAFTAGVAFDRAGNLYVSDVDTGAILVYAPPYASGNAPAVTVALPDDGCGCRIIPEQLGIDPGGTLYAGSQFTGLVAYATPLSAGSKPLYVNPLDTNVLAFPVGLRTGTILVPALAGAAHGRR